MSESTQLDNALPVTSKVLAMAICDTERRFDIRLNEIRLEDAIKRKKMREEFTERFNQYKSEVFAEVARLTQGVDQCR